MRGGALPSPRPAVEVLIPTFPRQPDHSGEDVAAQWRVMERFGGAGIVPSGAVHLGAPTTMPDGSVDPSDLLFEADRAG